MLVSLSPHVCFLQPRALAFGLLDRGTALALELTSITQTSACLTLQQACRPHHPQTRCAEIDLRRRRHKPPLAQSHWSSFPQEYQQKSAPSSAVYCSKTFAVRNHLAAENGTKFTFNPPPTSTLSTGRSGLSPPHCSRSSLVFESQSTTWSSFSKFLLSDLPQINMSARCSWTTTN